MQNYFCVMITLLLANITLAQESTINVSSITSLQEAVDKALPGQTITLADGIYTAESKILVKTAGSAEKPIVIAAQTIGGVEINGTGGFELGSSAAFVVIRGFKFTHEAGKTKIAVGANHCRITRNLFECKGKGAYLSVSGDDNQIDHNTFQNKFTEGQMISVQGPGGSGMAQRTWIHHNYFYKFAPTSNNCSSIQVGLSGRSLSSSFTLVEFNLFSQTRGENENICNKSCNNIYRYNTFGEGVTELSLRHGNYCQVYGNYFIGSDGIRFYGSNHKIFSNYFENCSPAINIGNGDGIIPPDKLVMHDRPDSVEVTFNTLINNKVNIIMANRNGGLGATYITVAHNIIQGGGPAVKISGNIVSPTWKGNIIWKTEEVGTIPAEGYQSVDPLLIQGKNGVYHISAKSPAIGNTIGSFPYVIVDIDGQTRSAKPDAGADQFSSSKIINGVLTLDAVGQNAAF